MISGGGTSESNSISGSLKKVSGYTGYSDNPDEQSGYYVPVKLSAKGETMTFKQDGIQMQGKVNIPYSQNTSVRVEPNHDYTIEVDGVQAAEFNTFGTEFL